MTANLTAPYDQLPFVFLFTLVVFVVFAKERIRFSERASRISFLCGWIMALLYVIYQFTVGNFEYPVNGIGAIIRGVIGGYFVYFSLGFALSTLRV